MVRLAELMNVNVRWSGKTLEPSKDLAGEGWGQYPGQERRWATMTH